VTLGAIPYTIVSLAVFGLVLIIGGYLMESVVNMNNELIATPDLPYSMQRVQFLIWPQKIRSIYIFLM
jgi:hypothetical protein